MLRGRGVWVRFSRHFSYLQQRRLCNHNPSTSPNKQPSSTSNGGSGSGHNGARQNAARDLQAYRDLDKLDFVKAAKILFSNPPKEKKFGLDFHLVQLFFALMPSLAVYLVALYARHEMRKMEAEHEEKRKAEEGKKAEEGEGEKRAEEVKVEGSDPELLKVKERLEALEKTVKEIVVGAKKPSDEKSTNRDQNQGKDDPKSRPDDSHTGQQQGQGSQKRGSHEDVNK